MAKLQRIQNRYKGMVLGQERNDWTNRTASDLQRGVRSVWSPRQQQWIQPFCMSALICTDQAGDNEQRLITASGDYGRIPDELVDIVEAYGFQTVPLDNERLHAEARGVRWVDLNGLKLQSISAGFDVCYDCECAPRGAAVSDGGERPSISSSS